LNIGRSPGLRLVIYLPIVTLVNDSGSIAVIITSTDLDHRLSLQLREQLRITKFSIDCQHKFFTWFPFNPQHFEKCLRTKILRECIIFYGICDQFNK